MLAHNTDMLPIDTWKYTTNWGNSKTNNDTLNVEVVLVKKGAIIMLSTEL